MDVAAVDGDSESHGIAELRVFWVQLVLVEFHRGIESQGQSEPRHS